MCGLEKLRKRIDLTKTQTHEQTVQAARRACLVYLLYGVAETDFINNSLYILVVEREVVNLTLGEPNLWRVLVVPLVDVQAKSIHTKLQFRSLLALDAEIVYTIHRGMSNFYCHNLSRDILRNPIHRTCTRPAGSPM